MAFTAAKNLDFKTLPRTYTILMVVVFALATEKI
jgi:hypothetical protein